MIGMATVANPELEGIKNESDEEQEEDEHEARPGRVGDEAFCPVEHRVGDLAVVHDHGDAAGDADDEGHPEQVPRPVDERAGVRL